MNKIKILFYSHTVDFAGTWRSHERILLNIDKDKFDVFVFYNPNQNNDRLEYLKTQMPVDHIIPFNASIDKLGPDMGYPYVSTNFSELARSMNFDIIHFARSGYYEWPFTERISPIQIETNIFGGRYFGPYLDCSVTICDTITRLRGKSDYTLYNPIPLPMNNDDDLKSEFNIPDDYHVFGRVGRKAGFNNVSILSLRRLKDMGYKFKYIILGACRDMISSINGLGLTDDCIIVEPTNDDHFIHKFHNTIDVFLHYRSDGECHSTAISQAMIYGIPIISHYAGYNGQVENIRDGGYVASGVDDYTQYLLKLVSGKQFYESISTNAKNRALDFEQGKIVKQWEDIYISYYKKKNEV